MLLLQVGLAHARNRLVCKRIARALAAYSIHAGDWSGDGTKVCAEIVGFAKQRPQNIDFALMALTSLAEDIRGKQCHESRKHRLQVQTGLRNSAGLVAGLLQLLSAQQAATDAQV